MDNEGHNRKLNEVKIRMQKQYKKIRNEVKRIAEVE